MFIARQDDCFLRSVGAQQKRRSAPTEPNYEARVSAIDISPLTRRGALVKELTTLSEVTKVCRSLNTSARWDRHHSTRR